MFNPSLSWFTNHPLQWLQKYKTSPPPKPALVVTVVPMIIKAIKVEQGRGGWPIVMWYETIEIKNMV